MKDEFITYLKSIGIGDPLRKRIENIYNFYADNCSYDIKDIFISEYIKEDGTREYETIWLFSDQYAMEGKIITNTYDCVPIINRLIRWEINSTEFDYKQFTDKSRMSLLIIMGELISGTMKASKENCVHLVNIFKKYILPNMIK